MTVTALSSAEEALARGDWGAARTAYEEVLRQSAPPEAHPEAHDGLGRALWWLRDVDGAIFHRERAYTGFRKRNDDARAVPIALWLAREYLEAAGNEPVSAGWLARAEGIVRDLPPGPSHGWLALTRGRLALDPSSAVDDARAAVAAGRDAREPDLEATGHALLGLALIARGEVQEGMRALDEAMVVATAGEVEDPVVFGDVCCLVTRAAEEAGDVSRLEKWNEVVMGFMTRTSHAPLLEFCGTCCAEVLAANGQLQEAEGWLVRTLAELEGTGHRARCVHPAAKLAELRLMQGRVEEAQRLLSGFEDRPDALRASAAVHLAKGETAISAALLLRRLSQVGESMLSGPLLVMLVDVQLAQGDRSAARATGSRLDALASRSAMPRLQAAAHLVAGRVAAASDEPTVAEDRLEAAVAGFDRLEMPLEAAAARFALASVMAGAEPALAEHEARLAFDAFDRAGATAPADRAAALLRRLGGPARTGPKAIGLLSRRELDVLPLVGEGLTNAEIAARLFISTKTAGHHVSSILAKLHLRNRAEAGAFATREAAAISDAR